MKRGNVFVSIDEGRKRSMFGFLFFIILDACFFILSFFLAYMFHESVFPGIAQIWQNSYCIVISFCVTAFNFFMFDLYYQKNYFRRFLKLINLTLAVGCSLVEISALSFLDRSLMVGRLFLLTFFLTFFLLAFLNRLLYSLFFLKVYRKRMIVIGESAPGKLLLKYLLESRKNGNDPGLDILGYISQFGDEDDVYYEGVKWLGRYEDLSRIIKENNVELLVYALEGREDVRVDEILIREKLAGCNLISAIALYSALTGRVPYKDVSTSWLIEDCLRANKFTQIKVKRVMDIVFGGLFFLISLPVGLLCAAIIKVGTKGAVFYVQERIGTFGVPFKIYKFRTMCEIEKGVEETAENWHKMNEQRITPVGKWLRKFHLDEIPQFINVIRGNMSIVGPRPEMAMFTDQCEKKIPFYRLRLAVKPGLTGWAQVWYRHTSTLSGYRQKFEYDLYYLSHISVKLDLEIMIRTVLHVLGIHKSSEHLKAVDDKVVED